MKIAVSTYSFQRLINAGGMSQLDCIRQAREMGFDGVEIMELFPPEGMEREEYAGRIASLCRSLDFPVVNYTVSADFLAGSGKNPEAGGDPAAEAGGYRRHPRSGGAAARCGLGNPGGKRFPGI